MLHTEDSDIVVGSKTQSLETVQAVLDGDGYVPVDTEQISDQPAEEEQPAGEESIDIPGTPEEPTGDTEAQPEGEQPAPPEPEPPAAEEPAAEPERKKKRPGKLERELQKSRDQVAELTNRLETLEKNRPAGAAGDSDNPPEVPAAQPKPKLKDFVDAIGENETYEEAVERYTDAMLNWRTTEDARQNAERAVTDHAKSKTDAEEADRRALADQWNAQLEIAKAAHDDWDEKIGQTFEQPVTNAVMTAAVQTLEDGAELVYWLANHPEEAARIQRITALKPNPSSTQINRAFAAAYRELGKVDLSAVGSAPEPAPPQPTHAAPSPAAPPAQGTPAARESRAAAAPKVKPKMEPPTPVGSRGGSPKKTRIEDYSPEELRRMPDDEYRRLRGM